MALDTTKIQLPKSVVTQLIGKVQDTSTIAALSPAQPQIFADETTMVFNPTAEAEVVAEGAKKGVYEFDYQSVCHCSKTLPDAQTRRGGLTTSQFVTAPKPAM